MSVSSPEYDVVIAGGGVAGVAAAIEAARNGMNTALLEKTVFPGGLATSGLINIYLPLCDGLGRQVVFGIAEELLKASIQYGPGDIPDPWLADRDISQRAETRYYTAFNPASFTLALDELLEEAGVDIWLDTLVCGVCKQGNLVTGLEVETKSGRLQIDSKCVIDATGDADVAFRAGAPCIEADNWLAMWTMDTGLAMARLATEANNGEPLMKCVQRGSHVGQAEGASDTKYSGTDVRDVTRMVLDGRRLLREEFLALQTAKGMTGRRNEYPITLPAMAQFRTTRRIDGITTISGDQVDASYDDSIGICGDWRRAGPVWEIPYSCLLPREITGLLSAGRCISTSGDAWDALRVIPAAALTGQVSGLAASMSVKQGITPDRLSIDQLQAELVRNGIHIHR